MIDQTADRDGAGSPNATEIASIAALLAVRRAGAWERDLGSGAWRWSDELWEMFGLEPRAQAPVLDQWIDWVHPDDRERVRASYTAIPSIDVGPPEMTYRVTPPDGLARIIRSQALRGFGAGERVVVGVAQDVTAEIEAERAHEARLVAFRSALDVVSEAVVIRGANDRPIWHNRAYRELFGRIEAEIADSHFGAFITPDDLVRLGAWREEIRTTGKVPAPPVLTATHPDGTERYWEPAPASDQVDIADPQMGRILAGRDVTDRVLVERSLADRSADFEAIFAAAPRCLVVMNESGTIVRCNPVGYATFGWPEGELEGHNVAVLTADLTPEEHDAYLQHYLRTGIAATSMGLVIDREHEVRARRHDGTTFPALLLVVELPPDSTGRRFLGTVLDLTARHAQEEQVRILQKNDALGTLIAGVAHDFNNLLTVISGSLQMAQQGRGDLKQWLIMATDGANRGALLVRQLLRVARPGSAGVVPIDFAEEARDAVRMLTETTDRRIRFSIECAPDVPLVDATPSGAQQILMNLLVNASDAVLERLDRADASTGSATPPGRVDVIVRPADADRSWVLIQVRDNGSGVAPEIRDRIFDAFFTTKESGRGTGIGLSAVLGLVRQFRGTITCEAAPDGGTAFVVLLPASSSVSQPEPSEPSRQPAAPSLTGARVLLVDDDEAVLAVTAAVLRAAGASVTVARSAHEALGMMETLDADVAVFDLNMPTMTGWEFLEHARARQPELRLVVMSGYIDETLLQKHRPDAVIQKPSTPAELIAAVSRTT